MAFLIERPTLKDIPQMRALVSDEVQRGTILERSEDEMANAIRSYHIVRDGGEIVGFCALYVYSPCLGELRSLIVRESHRGRGIASTLIESIKLEARNLGLSEVLVLTYKETLFQKLGFVIIDKTLLPNHKIWADCIKCKHFPICDEIALIAKV